jgi:trigger factor
LFREQTAYLAVAADLSSARDNPRGNIAGNLPAYLFPEGLTLTSTETNTEVNPLQREINVEIPTDVVERERESIVSKYQKLARIPGFRRGKVPASIVKQRFAEDINSEIVEALIPRYFREESQKQNLLPISQPRVTDLHLHDGEPLRFKAEFEVMPEIEVHGYTEIVPEKTDATVTDEEVEQALNNLREQNATYVAVEEDRAIADGDFAQISFKGTPAEGSDPVEVPEALVEIGSPNTVPEFSENLRGAKVGEERAFDINYPADFQDERLAGKTLHYDAKITGIKTKNIPELNDDFAKEVGAEFQTLDDLRTRIRAGMVSEKEHQAEHKAKDKLVEDLVAKYDFPVPKALVDQQIDMRLERGLRALAAQGMRAEDLRKMDLGRLRDGQREAALREVKASLLLDKIADAEKIEVSDEEMDREIEGIARQTQQTAEVVRQRLTQEGAADRIRNRIRNEKALEFLYRRSA